MADDDFDLRKIRERDDATAVAERRGILEANIAFEAPAYVWMAVQGAVLLAMRHPQFTGPSLDIVAGWAEQVTAQLVEMGALTEAEADDMWRSERAITAGMRADHQGKPIIIAEGEIVCIGCGCTDRSACPNRCHWVQVDRAAGVGLCSNCAKEGD